MPSTQLSIIWMRLKLLMNRYQTTFPLLLSQHLSQKSAWKVLMKGRKATQANLARRKNKLPSLLRPKKLHLWRTSQPLKTKICSLTSSTLCSSKTCRRASTTSSLKMETCLSLSWLISLSLNPLLRSKSKRKYPSFQFKDLDIKIACHLVCSSLFHRQRRSQAILTSLLCNTSKLCSNLQIDLK